MPSHSTLIGAAGQHFVLCQLLRHSWVAALAPEGVPNTDIIMTDIKGNRQFAIQVKTRSGKGHDKGWHMSHKHEKLVSRTLFYCFVDFGSSEPVTYIIPSSVVARNLKLSHQIWLAQRGKRGRKHRDNPIRRLLPDYSLTLRLSDLQMKKIGADWLIPYKECWSILHKK